MHRSPVRCVTGVTGVTGVPSQRRRARAGAPAAPVDLAAWRSRHEVAVRRTAAAPVRYVPAAFLDALQGSWGGLEPVEAAALELVRRVSAR
ncbi:MAG: hypothetical protein Q8R60_03235 [Mycobacteriales bacterium]|nr:hypothetical protein [Mycobacteriales bacterium]